MVVEEALYGPRAVMVIQDAAQVQPPRIEGDVPVVLLTFEVQLCSPPVPQHYVILEARFVRLLQAEPFCCTFGMQRKLLPTAKLERYNLQPLKWVPPMSCHHLKRLCL